MYNDNVNQISECDHNYNLDNNFIEVKDTKQWLTARRVFGILGFFGFAIVYAMRVNLSVAIVAMVNNTVLLQLPNNSNVFDYCPVPNVTSSAKEILNGEFTWDEPTQGIILGSFFYGYVLTQVPAGRLSEIFGGKLVFGCGVFITAVFTLISPFAARISAPLFVTVRVFEGMAEGLTYPAMHTLMARWIPPLERNRFGAYVYAGAFLGSVVSLPLSGWLCTLDYMGGWPLVFYIFGAFGIVWYVFWLLLVYDSPSEHPWICKQERAFILTSIGPIDKHDDAPLPWFKILTSLPLWAIIITQCGQGWAFYTQLTELPIYMSRMLHFDIQQNAIFCALPHLTAWGGGIVISIFADWLLMKKYVSLATSYKLFNTIGSVIPSLGLLAVAWLGCERIWVQVALAVSGIFMGAVFAGNKMNHISLSPRYAGTLCGITNGAANISGFLAPYITGLIIEGKQTLGQWNIVFYLAAFINIGANLFYILFASDQEQVWSQYQTLS